MAAIATAPVIYRRSTVSGPDVPGATQGARTGTGDQPETALAEGGADVLEVNADRAPSPPAADDLIVDVYRRLLRVEGMDPREECPEHWDNGCRKELLWELRDAFDLVLGDNPVPVLLALVENELEEEIAIRMMDSLYWIHLGGKKDALDILTGRGGRGGQTLEFAPEVEARLLNVALSGEGRPRLRTKVLESLRYMLSEKAADTISRVRRAVLDDRHEEVRAAALGLLYSLGEKVPIAERGSVIATARVWASVGGKHERDVACEILQRDPASAPLLMREFARASDRKERDGFFTALGNLRRSHEYRESPTMEAEWPGIVRGTLEDRSLRGAAFRELALMATAETALPIFEEIDVYLRHPEETERRQALSSLDVLIGLRVLGGPLRARLLEVAESDPSKYLRGWAAESARRIDYP